MTSINLEAMTARIREVAGADLDRVILYGSYAWGGWDPETSDIDVPVLTRACEAGRRLDIHQAIAELRLKKPVFGNAADRIEFSVRPAADFFALREFHSCMESKTLRLGKVLWTAPGARDWPVLPVEEARAQVVRRGFVAARQNISRARYAVALDRAHPDRGRMKDDAPLRDFECRWPCGDAYAAACLVLRAGLYARDIDPSDKAVRWSVSKLCERLAIPFAAASLPEHFYFDSEFEGPLFERDARGPSSASMRSDDSIRR